MQHLQEETDHRNQQFFFFAKWPKIPLEEILMMIYFWSMDQTRKSTANMMSINNIQPSLYSFPKFGRCMFSGHRNKPIHSVWGNSCRKVRRYQI